MFASAAPVRGCVRFGVWFAGFRLISQHKAGVFENLRIPSHHLRRERDRKQSSAPSTRHFSRTRLRPHPPRDSESLGGHPMRKATFVCLALIMPGAAGHDRNYPRFPPPPLPRENGSGEPPSPPLAPAKSAHKCDLKAIEVNQVVGACTLTPDVALALSESFARARHLEASRSAWQLGCIVSMSLALLLLVLGVIWQWMKCHKSERKENDEAGGIRVVYLRPDAWPMRVENPGGDEALTVAVAPTEICQPQFIPSTTSDTWVQMGPPVTNRSQSSTSIRDGTSQRHASGSEPSPSGNSPP